MLFDLLTVWTIISSQKQQYTYQKSTLQAICSSDVEYVKASDDGCE